MSDLPSKAGEVQEFVAMLNSSLATKGSFPNMAEVQHPLAKLFNPIPKDELEQLAKDIEKDGLIHEMVLYQQKILDGNTRFEALKRFRHEFIEDDFRCLEDILIDPDDKAAERYVISANALRRHLSKEERDVLGAKYFLAMPKGKAGNPELQRGHAGLGTKEKGVSDQLTQNLRELEPKSDFQALTTTVQHATVEKRPYDQRLEEAAAMIGGTPGGIRAQLPALQKKGPEAGRAVIQKPRRAPSKPKPLIMSLGDGLTLRQIFDDMLKKGYKMLDGTVKGYGRVVFTADADIKPQKAFYTATKSEIIDIATAEDPPISESDALDMLDYCKSKGIEYKDWAAALRNYRRRGWLWSQKPKPPPQRGSAPQRAPQGRSTVKTVAQHNEAAAKLERDMKASLDREERKWNRN
jgi:hypothetical protein